MKRKNINRGLFYIIGLLVLALGIILNTKAGLGGLNGRALRKGDVLRILEPQRPVPAHLEMRYALMENMPFYRENTDAPAMVRVVLGPQDGYFSREGLNAFFS